MSGRLRNRLRRERPKRHRTDHTDLDPPGARRIDSAAHDARGRAVCDDDIIRVVNQIFLAARVLLLDLLIPFKPLKDTALQLVRLEVQGVDNVMRALF